jgi:hypothetical protein
MGLYRKKPVVIEAVQLDTAHRESSEDALRFLGLPVGSFEMPVVNGRASWWRQRPGEIGTRRHALVIPTLEGDMTAEHGDWIIKGVNGEFYPCKPDIFEKTYEPA